MNYMCKYNSEIGNIIIVSDGENLTGLWFEGQKHFLNLFEEQEEELEIFTKTKRWLDIYFSGKKPEFSIPVIFSGTEFRVKVWNILKEIPYGEVITYGDIAKRLAEEKGIKKMSAQAVGAAVGHNPISIIVPCHRVIGNNNNLTGYAGGLDKKKRLLEIEGIDISKMTVPEK
ncbi:MAG: methylated-DNA--[Clostridia bacterium]|nr:methylated-DNA--[protein]-cysteine S-methyltransferase [Clostridia bacterium]